MPEPFMDGGSGHRARSWRSRNGESEETGPRGDVTTLVVRFWPAGLAGQPAGLRCQVRHVQSGETTAFVDLDALIAYLRRATGWHPTTQITR